MPKKTKIALTSATALVIANMIGTGVFTSLGLQLEAVTNTWSILLLWGLGGLMAICGAFSYAELGTQFRRSGGEYHFLSELYHPLIGYLSGWVSMTVGFAAPVALSAWAIGEYMERYVPIPMKLIAILFVLLISAAHSSTLRQSAVFQQFTTGLKIVLIVIFVIGGFAVSPEISALDWSSTWKEEVALPGFAVALVYVTYAYTGWNSATYIVDEIKDVRRNLPRALLIGTISVSVLYIFLQIIFLRHTPLELLQGEIEVGQIAAQQVFGEWGGRLISSFVAIMLISSISAMVWVGPRVSMMMGKDYSLWRILQKENNAGIPVIAIWLQAIISVLMILTGSFEQILLYSGFVLTLFTTLSVFGVILLRIRKANDEDTYKSPLFPIPQLLFIGLSLWILVYLAYDKPQETLIGVGILVIGIMTFVPSIWLKNRYK